MKMVFSQRYPQESVGQTLFETSSGDERRRVFAREHGTYVEVCEMTRGPLTWEIYNAPEHHHSVHLRDRTSIALARQFFSRDGMFLVDLMDELDERGIPYGYLNSVMGRHVSYRPARKRGRRAGDKRLASDFGTTS